MEYISIFREFGYPAVVTGALLWIYLTTMREILAKLNDILVKITTLESSVSECRSDIKDIMERRK